LKDQNIQNLQDAGTKIHENYMSELQLPTKDEAMITFISSIKGPCWPAAPGPIPNAQHWST